MWQRGSLTSIFAVFVIASVFPAGAAPMQRMTVNAAMAARVTVNPTQLSALRSARLRKEAVGLRANIRALAARQPELAKRVDFDAIDKSGVPVLVTAAQPQTLRVITRPDHYTAITQIGNSVVTIDGTRTTVALRAGRRLPSTGRRIALQTVTTANAPGITDALEHVRVERTMSGYSVSFVRFGHLYDLSIDCPDAGKTDPEAVKPDADDLARIKKRFGALPQGPSQCTEDNALSIAKQLEVLGGGAQ